MKKLTAYITRDYKRGAMLGIPPMGKYLITATVEKTNTDASRILEDCNEREIDRIIENDKPELFKVIKDGIIAELDRILESNNK